MNTQHIVLNKCSLLLSRTRGAEFKSSPPYSDTWEPTNLAPLIPRGWGVMAAVLAQPGPHLGPQTMHHLESAGSSLCAKAMVSPPLRPPRLGAPLSPAGAGQVCSGGWSVMSGNTTLGPWGLGTRAT